MKYLSEKSVTFISVFTFIILSSLGLFAYIHQRVYSEPARLTDLKPLPDTDDRRSAIENIYKIPMRYEETADDDRKYLSLLYVHGIEEVKQYFVACQKKNITEAHKHRDQATKLADNLFLTLFHRAKMIQSSRKITVSATYFELMALNGFLIEIIIPETCPAI